MADNTEQLAADVKEVLQREHELTIINGIEIKTLWPEFDKAQDIITQLLQIIQEQGEDIKGLRNSGDKVVEYWAEQSLVKTKAIRELEV